MKIRKDAAARMTSISKDPNHSAQASSSRAQGGSVGECSQQSPEPVTDHLWDTLLVGWVGRGGGGSDSGDPSALWPVSYDDELHEELVSRQARGAVAESPVQRQLAALDVHKRHVNRMESLQDLLDLELQFFGDGCIFLNYVLQPLFNYVAEQVGLMGGAKEEPALRVGYDDMNESACSNQVLRHLSGHLAGPPAGGTIQLRRAWEELVFKAYSAPLDGGGAGIPDLGQATAAVSGRYPRNQERLDGFKKLQLKQKTPHLVKALCVTRDMWGDVFRKTFIENRSIGMVWVAFNRLYVLHAMMLCCMCLWVSWVQRGVRVAGHLVA